MPPGLCPIVIGYMRTWTTEKDTLDLVGLAFTHTLAFELIAAIAIVVCVFLCVVRGSFLDLTFLGMGFRASKEVDSV